MREKNTKTRLEEFEWKYDDTRYVRENSVAETINEIQKNKLGADLFLKFGLYEWRSTNSMNPLNRITKKHRKKLDKTLMNRLKKILPKYNLKYVKLERNDIFIHCLPAFEGLKVGNLELSLGWRYNRFTNEQLKIICGLLSDADQVDKFKWGVEHDNDCWAQSDAIIKALSKTKNYKMFNIYSCSRAMLLPERPFFHKMMTLKNLEGVNLDYRDVSDHHRILLQKGVSDSGLKRVRIGRMNGFDKDIIYLFTGPENGIEYSLQVEASGATEVRNFEVIWPMIQTKKIIHFDFGEDRKAPKTSFTKNKTPRYPVNVLLHAIEQEQISTSRNVVDILLEDNLVLEYTSEDTREQIIGYIYPALKMLSPEVK